MNELVISYSYTGNTEHIAGEYARENGLALCKIVSAKKLGKVAAYTAGCIKALKGAGMPIEAPVLPLGECEAAQIFAPIWAGSIAPPMNSALALLPKGAKVGLHMVSGSGSSNQDGITERLRILGLEVTSYEDIRK